MIKKIIIFYCFLMSISIYSQQILKEIYYNSEKTQIIGFKEYLYDDRKNIKTINTYDADHNLQIVFKYIYNINKLITVNEYMPYSNAILKYSTFLYNNNGVIKKMDFDNGNNILLYHNFIYNKKGSIIEIRDILPNGTYLGKRQFVYKDNKLLKELSFDEKGNLLIKKIYSYNGELIHSIDFFTKQGIKIRVISRVYSKKNDVKLSLFGFNTNFFDFR